MYTKPNDKIGLLNLNALLPQLYALSIKMNMSSSTGKGSNSSTEKDGELRRGPWTMEEDTLLIHYIASHGEGRWNLLAKRAGLKRTGKSCRLRWLNYLNPDVKRGNLTPYEQLLILDLHSKWGNRWSKIAQYLPGRTDNEIKNYWRTRVQKQARHLKVDANSTAFQDIIRCYWMPRLRQKMEGLSSQSSMLSQNPTADPLLSQERSELPLPSLTSPPQLQEVGPEERMLKHQEFNSDSEQCTRPSISSIDSRDVPQLPQIPELATSPFQTNNCGFLSKDCYYVDNGSYAMNVVLGGSANPGGDSPVAEQGWGCDFEDGLWNMDELLIQ